MHSPVMELAVANLRNRPQPSETRTITAVRGEDIEPFQDAVAIAAGQVMIVSLDAVAEHFGAEWQGRRAEAYDRSRRTLSKRLASCGAFARTSETDYVLRLQDMQPAEAEIAAMEMLREIVQHFIEEPAAAQLRLFRIDRLSGDQAVCEILDTAKIIARAERRVSRDDLASGLDILSSETWTPFITGDGRKVRPSCILEPVFDIASHHRIGYRLRRRLIDVVTGEALSLVQQHNLARADILRIDNATLARGIDRLNSAADHEGELSLIMPVSYFSLTHPEGGERLGQMFARARTSVRAGVICEIYDIEGISQAALSAAVAVVRPWSLFIVGYLSDEKPRASAAMKAAGIRVLSFTAPENIESDAEFIGWLRAAVRSAQGVGRSVMVYGCHSQRRLAIAGLLGATHASLSG